MTVVIVERGGPSVSLQDAGRHGWLGIGLSPGGAADRLGYLEALALTDLPNGAAVVEFAGLGGAFRFETATRFSLAGATMRATLNGDPIECSASHFAPAGALLDIAAITGGVYGYLAFGGGIEADEELGGRGYHRIGGFGRPLEAGDRLPLGPDTMVTAPPMRLMRDLPTGPIRVMPGPQTGHFAPDVLETFAATSFTRSTRANRQGVRLDHDGAPFSMGEQLNQVSDFIAEGDIQMTGDGTPYVLLADCQTIGGYPRIGTVLPADLPRISQAMAGDALQFRFVTLAEAETSWTSCDAQLAQLKTARQPRIRNPREMTDLLSYNLVDRPGREILGDA